MRVYRKLEVKDLELVVQMNQDFREGFIDRENTKEFLSNDLNWLIACVEDEKVIGFAYGYEMKRLDRKQNMLYIHEVGVLPEYKRQGIGSALLKEMKELSKSRKVYKIFLFTQKHNIPACRLYEKAGGKKTEDGKDDDVTYFFANNG